MYVCVCERLFTSFVVSVCRQSCFDPGSQGATQPQTVVHSITCLHNKFRGILLGTPLQEHGKDSVDAYAPAYLDAQFLTQS